MTDGWVLNFNVWLRIGKKINSETYNWTVVVQRLSDGTICRKRTKGLWEDAVSLSDKIMEEMQKKGGPCD